MTDPPFNRFVECKANLNDAQSKKSHRYWLWAQVTQDWVVRASRISTSSRWHQGSLDLVSHSLSIFLRYRIGEVLGRGSFSTARDCICLSSSQVHAVKVIRSDNDYTSQWSSCSMYRREVEFLRSLGMFDFYDFHSLINATRSSKYCEVYRVVPGSVEPIYNHREVYWWRGIWSLVEVEAIIWARGGIDHNASTEGDCIHSFKEHYSSWH